MTNTDAAPAAVAGPAIKWPDTCDGLEQEAFDAWAKRERHDMQQHPLHYLFLDEKTYAARQGWKAGLLYAVAQMKIQAAPALEAPAAPSRIVAAARAFYNATVGDTQVRISAQSPETRDAITRLGETLRDELQAALAAAPQAPAAPVVDYGGTNGKT